PAVLDLSLAQFRFPVETQPKLGERGPFGLNLLFLPHNLLLPAAKSLLLAGPVTFPAATQAATQLAQTLALALRLKQPAGSLFAVTGCLLQTGAALLLKFGPLAVQLRLLAAHLFLGGEETAPALFEVSSKLFFLFLQGNPTLLKPIFLLEQGGLLSGDRG